ncbi:glutathione S-transferase family protein [Pontivivens ytuae]|uniref:Glutathione S-transferase n=1 Tax=Pontivivens ytuae TaxID=2789856 RepID=A0A7S9QDA5_9RHOB|nr:glutathione S-transferase family protein [Pontivivens ytuae]QPH55083.1 glutathione S-transferase [Pontivivens ytuae]
MSARYELIGLTASPYSMKVRALLRYRRIPFDWIVEMPQLTGRKVEVSPVLLPVLRHPMGRDMTDSTEIAGILEREIINGREVVPPGDDAAFLNALIEDMADEWLTKAMFWYRWSTPEGADFAMRWLGGEIGATVPEAMRPVLPATVRKRQEDRMPMVGATAENGPVIEAGYRAVLAAMNGLLEERGYLFGSRPALADFALFGQLSQLAFDPVSERIMMAEGEAVAHWLRRIDDASGLEGAWEDDLTVLRPLLELVGGDYLPFLEANAAALDAEQNMLEVELASGPYRQMPFRWQAKCLDRLRELHAGADLNPAIREMLEQTGCDRVLQG